jgi:intraflagellar transport protein 122
MEERVVLAGLTDGKVLKFYVDAPFPVEIATRKAGVTFSCQNTYCTLAATIDTHHNLIASEASTQEVLYTMEGVQSACFNVLILKSTICFVNGGISVIAGLVSSEPGAKSSLGRSSSSFLNAPEVQEQHIQVKAVGFHGQKIFSTQRGILSSVDIPEEKNIQKALENNDFPTAYKIACLGATETDWRLLAMRALRANHLLIAKKSFGRLKDTRYLRLIETIERHSGPADAVGSGDHDHTSHRVADLSLGRVRDRSGGILLLDVGQGIRIGSCTRNGSATIQGFRSRCRAASGTKQYFTHEIQLNFRM